MNLRKFQNLNLQHIFLIMKQRQMKKKFYKINLKINHIQLYLKIIILQHEDQILLQ